MENFSDRLKQLRSEKGVLQRELADYLNVSRVTITQYENGSRSPDDETKKKIAEYFNVSLDYLMGFSDIRNPYTNNINEEELTPEEIELLETIKNDPELSILFHDLKSAPKKKIKQMLDTWEFVNKQFDDMEKDLDDDKI